MAQEEYETESGEVTSYKVWISIEGDNYYDEPMETHEFDTHEEAEAHRQALLDIQPNQTERTNSMSNIKELKKAIHQAHEKLAANDPLAAMKILDRYTPDYERRQELLTERANLLERVTGIDKELKGYQQWPIN